MNRGKLMLDMVLNQNLPKQNLMENCVRIGKIYNIKKDNLLLLIE